MSFPTYSALNEQIIEHFQNKEYQQALELIISEGSQFPTERIMVDYWTMCSAARLENRALVYQVAEKFHADGLWYGEVMWRQTPSFQKLQGDPDFERIVVVSQKAMKSDPSSSESVLLKYFPKDHSPNSPLLIALHGNQSLASDTVPFWKPAVSKGYVLAVPQSTQAMFKDAFAWDDLDKSFADVNASYIKLKEELPFNENHIVLAGHSMGGLIAIQIALTGLINVRGFIANGPALPFMDAEDELESLLPPARERGLRGFFIIGENDTDIFQDEVRALAEKLKSAGIACELETVPGATHDYSPVYDAALLRALAFISASD
ncbi:MAG: alpha/beta hydrolase [Chloroflexi bacterium]|nr:alpha/beta hydrolase [Chloroflexota bacterium]